MGLVDAAVVGRLGAGPLGAVGLANGLFFGVAVIGVGVMMGLDPLLSQAVGAGDQRRASELLWQGLWLAGLATLVLSLPIALLPLLLPPAGIAKDIASDASWFLWMRLPGLFPMLAFVGLRAVLQARGQVRALVVATVIANLANVGLDLVLVFGWRGIPALGAAGAGLSTSVCSLLQLAILAVAVRSPERVRRSPRASDLRRALSLGVPVGLQMGAEVLVFALVGVLAGRFGKESLAAHEVALSLASFTFCGAVGVGQAGSVRVGWAIGAGDSKAARRAGLVAFGGGAGLMGLSAMLFFLAPGPLARLLTNQPEVIAATVPLLAVCAVFQISDGVQAVGAGVLRGAGQTRFSFVANLVGHYLVGLPIAIVLGLALGHGVIGLWWGLCAGLTAVAIALLARFALVSSGELKPLEAHPAPARQDVTAHAD